MIYACNKCWYVGSSVRHDECHYDAAPLPAETFVMPKTTKERQEDLRARRLMLGMTEVRGIYLPPDLHATLKAEANRLLKRRKAPKKDLRDSSEPC